MHDADMVESLIEQALAGIWDDATPHEKYMARGAIGKLGDIAKSAHALTNTKPRGAPVLVDFEAFHAVEAALSQEVEGQEVATDDANVRDMRRAHEEKYNNAK
jgi:hypothetical protein